MVESKTVNFHNVLDGKKAAILPKISSKPKVPKITGNFALLSLWSRPPTPPSLLLAPFVLQLNLCSLRKQVGLSNFLRGSELAH